MSNSHRLALFVVRGLLTGLALCITSDGFAQGGTWLAGKPMPTARNYLGVCVLDGKIYAIGGSTSTTASTSAVEMYDPIADTWTSKRSLPTALSYPGVCVFQGKIYVFGGSATMWSGVSTAVYVYDPNTDRWVQVKDSQHQYMDPVVELVDGQVYLIGGGKDAFIQPVRDVNMYTMSTDTWARKTDIPATRYMCTGSVFDGKIYCFGGTNADWGNVFYATVEAYDPGTDTWSSAPDMPLGRWSPAACTVDSLIYVMGGHHGQNATDRVDILNPRTNEWIPGPPLLQIRRGLGACVLGSRLYVIGGSCYEEGTPTFLNSMEFLDTQTSTGIRDDGAAVQQVGDYRLAANYPNPFNPSTTIRYELPRSSMVRLCVYDILGCEVSVLVSERRNVGSYEVKCDAAGLASGVYLYRLQAGEYVGTKKLLLIK